MELALAKVEHQSRNLVVDIHKILSLAQFSIANWATSKIQNKNHDSDDQLYL